MYPVIAENLLSRKKSYGDIDQQANRLEGYEQNYQQFGEGCFNGSFSSLYIDSDFSLFFESVNVSLNQRVCTPGNRYAIIIFDSSCGTQIVNGELIDGGNVLLLPPRSETNVVTSADMQVLVLDVARTLVEDTLLHQSLPIFDKTEFYHALISANIELNSALLVSTNHLLQRCAQLANTQSEGALNSYRQEVITMAMASFSNSLYTKKIHRFEGRKSSRFARYMNLRLHLDSSLHLDIDWNQLSSRFGLSRRSIEHLFWEFSGLTPARYIKVVRLNEIKRKLQCTDSIDTSIADIGARYGLWHESRLAQSYRAQFHELPSETRGCLMGRL